MKTATEIRAIRLRQRTADTVNKLMKFVDYMHLAKLPMAYLPAELANDDIVVLKAAAAALKSVTIIREESATLVEFSTEFYSKYMDEVAKQIPNSEAIEVDLINNGVATVKATDGNNMLCLYHLFCRLGFRILEVGSCELKISTDD